MEPIPKNHAALFGCLMVAMIVSGCNDSSSDIPAPVSVTHAPEKQAQVAAPVLSNEGLIRQIPLSGVIKGRVYMGGGAIGKSDVMLSEYDLHTRTTGLPLGMAVTDTDGNFSIHYMLKAPVRFLKLEARAVDYLGAADGKTKRHVDVLNAIFNGIVKSDDMRMAITPFTNVVYFRFRALCGQDEDPDAAFSQAVLETMTKGHGTSWGLPFSPVMTTAHGDDPGKLFHAAWDEAIRFERISADDYFTTMARDFSDGKFDGREGQEPLMIAQESITKSRRISVDQFTEKFIRAAQRYQLCADKSRKRDDHQRISANCP